MIPTVAGILGNSWWFGRKVSTWISTENSEFTRDLLLQRVVFLELWISLCDFHCISVFKLKCSTHLTIQYDGQMGFFPTFPGDVTGQEGETGSSALVLHSSKPFVPTVLGGIFYVKIYMCLANCLKMILMEFQQTNPVILLNFPYFFLWRTGHKQNVTPYTFIAQVPSVAMFERQVGARCCQIRKVKDEKGK